MRILFYAVATVVLAITVGCTVYKTDIQQGNVLTQDMTDKLKTGMTRSQVRFVLGTPLIADPFHPERWDYVYLYKKSVAAPAEAHQFTVVFDGDTLARIEGNISGPQAPPTPSDNPRRADAATESAAGSPPARRY
jgi:outer membrane protein assembly factor BamE